MGNAKGNKNNGTDADLDESDTALLISSLKNGDIFGELALLSGYPQTRKASCQAKTFCEIEVLDYKDFTKLLQTHPEISTVIVQMVAQRKKRIKFIENNPLVEAAVEKFIAANDSALSNLQEMRGQPGSMKGTKIHLEPSGDDDNFPPESSTVLGPAIGQVDPMGDKES